MSNMNQYYLRKATSRTYDAMNYFQLGYEDRGKDKLMTALKAIAELE